jgi:hypothetical protein
LKPERTVIEENKFMNCKSDKQTISVITKQATMHKTLSPANQAIRITVSLLPNFGRSLCGSAPSKGLVSAFKSPLYLLEKVPAHR